MSARREVEIIGGGLAGLSLGLALRRHDIPATVYEAGEYPRHRVCGEFIAGLDERTSALLGLEAVLHDARPHRHVIWYRGPKAIREQDLARPALALSRHTLDARLAEEFQRLGGRLRTGQRIDVTTTEPGRVFATGRRRAPGPWLGLKLHVRGFAPTGDLELHLGHNAYVGVCAVENGRVNVCGFFRRRAELTVTRSSALLRYLAASGLDELAQRLDSGEIDETSFSAVAGITFFRPKTKPDRISIGDAFAMIPPYTGNGMCIAFQSAACALEPIVEWAEGLCDWEGTVRKAMDAITQRVRRRLSLASALHPFLLSPAPQTLFHVANRTGLLPLSSLAQALHT